MRRPLGNPPRPVFFTKTDIELPEEILSWFEELDKWFNRVADLVTKIEILTATIDPASVAANTSAEQTFTVTGLETTNELLQVEKPTATAGIGIVNYRISAADTLAITFMNSTSGSLNPPSETYTIVVLKN